MARNVMARMSWVEGERFETTTGSGGEVHLAPTAYVEPTGTVSPMEALLVALGGCMGISVAPIFGKMRQRVTGYEIIVRGDLTERLPRVFEAITVEHHITGVGLDATAIQRALTLAEERYCGASAMLSKAARITHTVMLVEDHAAPQTPTA